MPIKPKFALQIEDEIIKVKNKLNKNQQENVQLRAELFGYQNALDWFYKTQKRGKKRVDNSIQSNKQKDK